MSSCPICHKNNYIKENVEPPFMVWTFPNELAINFEICANCGTLFCINLEDYQKEVK